MSKEAEEFFRKEKAARSEGIVKKLNKIVNFDMEGEILEAYATELYKKHEALEKQVEELNSKLIRVRDYATHRKEYSSNMRAILELLKNKL